MYVKHAGFDAPSLHALLVGIVISFDQPWADASMIFLCYVIAESQPELDVVFSESSRLGLLL